MAVARPMNDIHGDLNSLNSLNSAPELSSVLSVLSRVRWRSRRVPEFATALVARVACDAETRMQHPLDAAPACEVREVVTFILAAADVDR